MRVPADFEVGAATHSGLQRSANEDDYLLVAPLQRRPCALVAAVADGMGGVTGGAEASRTGLRGFGSGLLQDEAAAPAAAVDRGFATAWERILEQARLVPALREMGTTITAVAFDGRQAVLGHIGDSRAYLWRAGSLQQLSTDHTVRGRSSHQLLRCVGGGQQPQAPDLSTIELRPGDRFLLCTDGIWNTVPAGRIADALASRPPQVAAEHLVQLANAAGGPDNSTALVVGILAAAPTDPERAAQLPSEETPAMAEVTLTAGRQRLGGPRWPWSVLLVAGVLLLAVLLRAVTGFDLLAWLQSHL